LPQNILLVLIEINGIEVDGFDVGLEVLLRWALPIREQLLHHRFLVGVLMVDVRSQQGKQRIWRQRYAS